MYDEKAGRQGTCACRRGIQRGRKQYLYRNNSTPREANFIYIYPESFCYYTFRVGFFLGLSVDVNNKKSIREKNVSRIKNDRLKGTGEKKCGQVVTCLLNLENTTHYAKRIRFESD